MRSISKDEGMKQDSNTTSEYGISREKIERENKRMR